jgi:nitrile hydratase
VRFTSRELWGEAGTDGDVIHVDLFERYLQEA